MEQPVPAWLENLLGTAFFSVCSTHAAASRNECNMFCLDCNGPAFCFECRSSIHKDHRVIQIRRSSGHDVVKVADVDKVVNIEGVQMYVSSSAKVLYLKKRPLIKQAGRGVTHYCEVCERGLLNALRFCSLGCKVERIRRNGDTSFVLEEMPSRTSVGRGEEELHEGSQEDVNKLTPPSTSTSTSTSTSRTRKRKRTPQRAHLGF